jgi:copper chaperone CopZ
MVYPVLQVGSLVARCAADIEKFLKEVPGVNFKAVQSVMYDLYTQEGSYQDMKSSIKGQIDRFNAVLQHHEQTIGSFDYAHDILHFDEQERNQLWIMRTLLCYQMMIFGTFLMTNRELHDEVYRDTSFQRPFRPHVVRELPSFKLGIFGSLTPTSDIDIGIQYSGKTNGFAALDYVVGTMEDMFIHFLGIDSTLKLDIEYYADMMTLPNPDSSDQEHPDVFYLDTFRFEESDFKAMMPYAYASIYRNYWTAKKDLDEITHNTSGHVRELSDSIARYDKTIVIDELVMDTAKNMVLEYTSLSYAKAREAYYGFVQTAEKNVAVIRDMVQRGSYKGLTNQLVLQTMKDIAQSLIFRAESYVCAPTVMHVVRLLQADPKKLKYPTMFPLSCRNNELKMRLLNPQCEIGKYGFELSKLEQIGYIVRFNMTYCEINQPDAKLKCGKKRAKYESRLTNADERMKGIVGGRRKRRDTRKRGRYGRITRGKRDDGKGCGLRRETKREKRRA